MIHHALVLTDDLEASRAFYVDALGFEVADKPPLEFSGIWLRLPEDDDACIHLADRGEYLAHVATLGLGPVAGALDHVAVRRTGYDALAARLEQAGVEAVHHEVPGLFRQLFVLDPNGVRLELNVPV